MKTIDLIKRWLWKRRADRLARGWAHFYSTMPCPPSYMEPWLSPAERKHSKAGL